METNNNKMAGMYILGVAAYTFTHMPVIVMNEVKQERKEKKLEKYKKKLTAQAEWLVKKGKLDTDTVGEWLVDSMELLDSCSRWKH